MTVHTKIQSEITIQVSNKPDEVKLLVKAVQMKDAGKGWKEIKAQIGIQHSKLDRAWYLNGLLNDGLVEREAFAKLSEDKQTERVRALRAEGLSWGQISLRIGVTEGRTQTLFERATGIAAQGTRVKRGGRFLKEIGEAGYKGNHKGFGTEAKPGTHAQVVLKNKDDDQSILTKKQRAARARVQKQAAK